MNLPNLLTLFLLLMDQLTWDEDWTLVVGVQQVNLKLHTAGQVIPENTKQDKNKQNWTGLRKQVSLQTYTILLNTLLKVHL